jgi:hypothetical protein
LSEPDLLSSFPLLDSIAPFASSPRASNPLTFALRSSPVQLRSDPLPTVSTSPGAFPFDFDDPISLDPPSCWLIFELLHSWNVATDTTAAKRSTPKSPSPLVAATTRTSSSSATSTASAGPVRVSSHSLTLPLRISLLISSPSLRSRRTGRFRDLMRIGSVVIKSTAFPEWHSSQLIPWYHYVPMRYDCATHSRSLCSQVNH